MLAQMASVFDRMSLKARLLRLSYSTFSSMVNSVLSFFSQEKNKITLTTKKQYLITSFNRRLFFAQYKILSKVDFSNNFIFCQLFCGAGPENLAFKH